MNAVDLQCKQSSVDLMMEVQAGRVSCRRAATLIHSQIPKPNLTPLQRRGVMKMRERGTPVKEIANQYDINPSTVWRICKKHQPPAEKGETA